MGSFTINGKAKLRGIENVDERLVKILEYAAAHSPYDVELFSGKRSSGNHNGKAADIVLRDPNTGKEIPNLGAGGAAFEAYERFAKRARQIQQQEYPELDDSFRWGGYFSPSKSNQTGVDEMHFDVERGGAMALGSWDGGLNERGRKFVANLGAGQAYVADGDQTAVRAGVLPPQMLAELEAPIPPNREQDQDDKALHTAALALLGEAGGEGRDGMVATANIFDNRKDSPRYPNNLLDVVTQKNNKGVYQFSTFNNAGNGGNSPEERFTRDSDAYKVARSIVADVSADRIPDPLSGGTSYYAPRGMPGRKEPYWWADESKNGSVQIANQRYTLGPKTEQPATTLAAIESFAPVEKAVVPALGYAPSPPDRPSTARRTQRPKQKGPSFFDKVGGYNNFKKLERQAAPSTLKVASAVGNSILDTGQNLWNGAQKALTPQKPVNLPRPRPTRTASVNPVALPRPRPQQAPRFDFSKAVGPSRPNLQAALNTKVASLSNQPVVSPQGPRPTTTRNFDRAEQGSDVPRVRQAGTATLNPMQPLRPVQRVQPTQPTQPIQQVSQPNYLDPVAPRAPARPAGLGGRMNGLQRTVNNVRSALAPIRNVRHDIAGQIDGLKLAARRAAQQQIQQALGNRPSHMISLDRAASSGNRVGANGYIYAGSPGNFRQVGKVQGNEAKMYSRSNEKPSGYRYYDQVEKEWKRK